MRTAKAPVFENADVKNYSFSVKHGEQSNFSNGVTLVRSDGLLAAKMDKDICVFENIRHRKDGALDVPGKETIS